MDQNSNSFLSGLSPGAHTSLLSRASAVDLPVHMTLYEQASTPRYAYFLLSGLASIVAPTANGESAEVGFIGKEGLTASLHLLGPTRLSTRCMMQLSGNALRIPFSELQDAFANSYEIHARILEVVQEQSATVAQIAGCNRLHSAEQRLARWLLMAQDRTGSDVLAFTQEYLAEMIGTQRSTVTVIAGGLQRRGLIRYSRGRIRLVDRPGLEAASCDCYSIIQRLHRGLYAADRVELHSLSSAT